MPVELRNISILAPNSTGQIDVPCDINLTGSTPPVYRVNGVPLSLGQNQTPWLSNINAANYRLDTVGAIGVATAAATSGDPRIEITGTNQYAIQCTTTSASGYTVIALRNDINERALISLYGSQQSDSQGLSIGTYGGDIPILFLAGGFIAMRLNPPVAGYRCEVSGDVNIPTGSAYRINGVPLATGQNQTPWLSHIDGGNFRLLNTSAVNIGISTYRGAFAVQNNSSSTPAIPPNDYALALLLTPTHGIQLGIDANFSSGVGGGWIQASVLSPGSAAGLILQPLGGRVGIGVTNPAYVVDVAGDINLSAGSVYRINGVPYAGTPAGANTQIQWNNNGAFGASSSLAWNDTNTTLTVSGNASTRGGVLNLRSQAPLNLFPESTINVYADAVTTVQPYTTLLFLAGDGIMAPSIQIGIASSAGAPLAYIWQLTSTSMDVNGVLTVSPVFASPYAFLVKTNGLDRFAVENNNGRVGIWTTDPYSPLHVRAGISTILSAINSDTVMFLEHSSSAYLEMVCFGVQAGLLLGSNAQANSSQFMDVWDGANHQLKISANFPGSYMSFISAGVEHMRITGAGNVGIGTTSPSSSLSVYTGNLPTPAGSAFQGLDVTAYTPNGDSLVAILSRVYAGTDWTTATWRLGRRVDSSPIADIEFAGDRTIALRTNDQTRMLVASNGNVGIGQMFPSAPLDVNGMCTAWVFGGQSPSNFSACLDVESDRGIPTGQPNNTLTFAFNTSNNILTLLMVGPDGTQRAANIQM